jgi:hypothetical protein
VSQPSQEELLDMLAAEVARDPAFARRVRTALKGIAARPRRRAEPKVDVATVYAAGGEQALRATLAPLSVEELKDIVAHDGMDRAKLAMKWKTADRLIDFITEVTIRRAHKGEVFTGQPDTGSR